MKKILIATDFSAAAHNAALYGADMAKAIGAEGVLLHVYHIPAAYSEIPMALNQVDLREGAERNLAALKEELLNRTEGKVHIDTEVRAGDVYGEIELMCKELKPYAVIMGTQGKNAAERLFFGSHAVYTAQHLPWPLITVPPDVKFAAIKKIGLATDFDAVVHNTPVEELHTLVNDFHAELHILHTGRQNDFDPNLVFESGMMQEMLLGLNPQYHFLAGGDTDKAIMEFAEKNAIDLLLVLPKRHGLLEKLVHRSHAKQLVLHSHVPVMALHLVEENA